MINFGCTSWSDRTFMNRWSFSCLISHTKSILGKVEVYTFQVFFKSWTNCQPWCIPLPHFLCSSSRTKHGWSLWTWVLWICKVFVFISDIRANWQPRRLPWPSRYWRFMLFWRRFRVIWSLILRHHWTLFWWICLTLNCVRPSYWIRTTIKLFQF